MDQISGVIDVQGFSTNEKFYPREIAFVTDNIQMCFEVENDLDLEELSYKDAKTCLYQEHHVLGMHLKQKSIFNFNRLNKVGEIMNFLYTNFCNKKYFACSNTRMVKILNQYRMPIHVLTSIPTFRQLNSRYDNDLCKYHTLSKSSNIRCALRKANNLWQWICEKREVENSLVDVPNEIKELVYAQNEKAEQDDDVMDYPDYADVDNQSDNNEDYSVRYKYNF